MSAGQRTVAHLIAKADANKGEPDTAASAAILEAADRGWVDIADDWSICRNGGDA